MPNLIIEDTNGELHNYEAGNTITGRDLYNVVSRVTGIGQLLNGCGELAANAFRFLFQGREIANNQNQVHGLQNNSRITVVHNEQGGSNKYRPLAINSTMYSKQQYQNGSC